ncbi:hypothetical protein RI367_008581 [Sorochytrium milnesiophthora]
MPRRAMTNLVWQHFRRVDGRVVCSVCSQQFSAATSTENLSAHFSAAHGAVSSQLPLSSDQRQAADKALQEWVVPAGFSHHSVSHPSFAKLLHELHPGYTPPERPTLATQLQERHLEAKAALASQLHAAISPFSMTSDLWTSINGIPYIAITAHLFNID